MVAFAGAEDAFAGDGAARLAEALSTHRTTSVVYFEPTLADYPFQTQVQHAAIRAALPPRSVVTTADDSPRLPPAAPPKAAAPPLDLSLIHI